MTGPDRVVLANMIFKLWMELLVNIGRNSGNPMLDFQGAGRPLTGGATIARQG